MLCSEYLFVVPHVVLVSRPIDFYSGSWQLA